MLTYENFVSVLLAAIEQTDLNIAYTQELLDTHALGRSLSVTCLPRGVQDDRAPAEPPLRAVISFRWSPEFTVFSLRGSLPDGFDGVMDERILASSAGVGLEVEVTYTLPVTDDPVSDLTAVPQISRAVHELYTSAVPDSENPVRVEVALSFPQGSAARIAALVLHQSWPIGDALLDAELLSDIFEELCDEMHEVLETLAEIYLPDIRTAQPSPQELVEEATLERRYLKPPTA
jgi:hypothetical protein